MRLPKKTLERKLFQSGYRYIIAVDEVGMGALAGPVVICAALFTRRFYEKSHPKLHWLRDSKLLSSTQRGQFVAELAELKIPDFKFQLGWCYSKTIDRLNIYQAARLAMRRAVRRLTIASGLRTMAYRNLSGYRPSSIHKLVVLVDGKNKIDGLPLDQMPIIKGDRKVFAIACASILAKVYRDNMMVRYARRFPQYGFERHKGYGTFEHRSAIARYSRSLIHRKSFRV